MIYPVKMNHICLPKFGQGSNVCSGIGYIDGIQVFLMETFGNKDYNTFPDKIPYMKPTSVKLDNGYFIVIFFADEKFYFQSVIAQGIGKPGGSYGSPAKSVVCIDKEYAHMLSFALQKYAFSKGIGRFYC